ncbi:hypothetical protein J437_LFUL014093, partial [Ladona fulva]
MSWHPNMTSLKTATDRHSQAWTGLHYKINNISKQGNGDIPLGKKLYFYSILLFHLASQHISVSQVGTELEEDSAPCTSNLKKTFHFDASTKRRVITVDVGELGDAGLVPHVLWVVTNVRSMVIHYQQELSPLQSQSLQVPEIQTGIQKQLIHQM